TTSYVAPTLSINAFNTLFDRDEVYFAQFKPAAEVLWDGNVKKYTLCKDPNATPSCKFGEIVDKNGNPAVDAAMHRFKDGAVSYWNSVTDGNTVNLGGAGAKIPAPCTNYPTTPAVPPGSNPPACTTGPRKVFTYTGGYAADGRTPTGTT